MEVGSEAAQPEAPLPYYIKRVLGARVEWEGHMTSLEAVTILSVTLDQSQSARWLLLQVHPDKHSQHKDKELAATSRLKKKYLEHKSLTVG